MASVQEQCNNCKWWKTNHGLVWCNDVDAWYLGYGDEIGQCEFYNEPSEGCHRCNSWEPSAAVMNKNGWN